jgi:hypothetical protein
MAVIPVTDDQGHPFQAAQITELGSGTDCGRAQAHQNGRDYQDKDSFFHILPPNTLLLRDIRCLEL